MIISQPELFSYSFYLLWILVVGADAPVDNYFSSFLIGFTFSFSFSSAAISLRS